MRSILIVVVLLAATFAADADDLTIDIDSAHSRVSFTLGATLHKVKGTIPVSGGTVKLNTTSGGASGSIAAATAKADTGNDKRDRDMHGKVLESASHPSAQFVFDRIEGKIASSGKSSVTVHGEMRLHGASHPMSIPATLQINGGSMTADATFNVPYVKWGLKDPSKALLKVDKSVTVSVHLAGKVRR